MRLKHVLYLISAVMLLMGMTLTSSIIVETAHAADCVIPQTGSWPPCARNGSQQTNQSGCVIPQTGPWPPCAASGANSGASQSGCIIPQTGPWPPCARNGSANGGSNVNNNQGNSGGCVIPPRGAWPPCASGANQASPPPPASNSVTQSSDGMVTISSRTQVVHQGRGAKQSTVSVSGVGTTITGVEVMIDFTYSDNACASGGSVERGMLGYSLTSPSGTKVDLIDLAQLSGLQPGERSQMNFADGAPSPIHILSGRFASADPLSWFNGEDPNGTWIVTAFKNDWANAVCQHGVALHISTQ